MKVVIQRVKSASVRAVESDAVVGSIERGLFILVGIAKGDTEQKVRTLADKLKKIRLHDDDSGKMAFSSKDLSLPLLVVSQFTLLANTKDGNRPSFLEAEEPKRARELYELLIAELRKDLVVETGSFGNYMAITTSLDGPVTITLDL